VNGGTPVGFCLARVPLLNRCARNVAEKKVREREEDKERNRAGV
jgi:hypothetical protein